MKTFIQIYKQGYSNSKKEEFHGIGDFLRGTLGLYRLSKIYNFNLIVDFSLHPIKEYIEYIETDYTSLVKSNENNINFLYKHEILDKINNNEEIILLFGWFYLEVYDTPISEDETLFMKNLLIPNKNMLDYINLKLLEVPFTNFNIIHFRLGDDILVKNNNKNEFNINHIINNIDSNTNNILLSDSYNFKEFVREKNLNIFIFNTNICHLGFHNNIDLKDTLFEFFITIKANKVKSFSVYSWASGFTYAISFIYKIPYESKVNLNI